jgi:hypothetical protein
MLLAGQFRGFVLPTGKALYPIPAKAGDANGRPRTGR